MQQKPENQPKRDARAPQISLKEIITKRTPETFDIVLSLEESRYFSKLIATLTTNIDRQQRFKLENISVFGKLHPEMILTVIRGTLRPDLIGVTSLYLVDMQMSDYDQSLQEGSSKQLAEVATKAVAVLDLYILSDGRIALENKVPQFSKENPIPFESWVELISSTSQARNQ